MSTATMKPKLSERFTETVAPAARTEERAATAALAKAKVTERFAEIEANPFFKLLINPELTPEEQKELLAKAAAYDPEISPQENLKRKEQIALTADYLNELLGQTSEKVMVLQRGDGMTLLYDVYKGVAEEILKWNKLIEPQRERLAAFAVLRDKGIALNVFGEIASDIEAKEKWEAEKARKDEELVAKKRAEMEKARDAADSVRDIDRDILFAKEENAEYGNQRTFFTGKVKKSAQIEIDKNNVRIEEMEKKKSELLSSTSVIETAVASIDAEIEANRATTFAPADTQFPEYQKEKEVVTTFLKTAESDPNALRREFDAIIDSGVSLIKNTKTSLDKAVVDLDKALMSASELETANDFISGKFEVIGDALKEAGKADLVVSKSLEEVPAPAEGEEDRVETESEKRARDRLRESVNDHIGQIISLGKSVGTSIAHTESNNTVIRGTILSTDQARQQALETRGSTVSSTAFHATSTMITLNQAVSTEGAQTVKNLLAGLNEKNNETMKQIFTQAAQGIAQTNQDLVKIVERMTDMTSSVEGFAADIQMGLKETLDRLADQKVAAAESADAIGKTKAAAAEALREHNEGGPVTDGAAKKRSGRDPGSDFLASLSKPGPR